MVIVNKLFLSDRQERKVGN